jgi:hypothetical protein
MSLFAKKPDGRVRLLELMQRENAILPSAKSADFEAAKQRCLECRSKKLCDEGSVRHSLFCPNTHYLQTLKGTLTF